ncbi:DM13 domain-containing protein [Patescibacteria group bacterium]|nr:DM13 domain-containing protein [Patescibacteria group bacterium]
MNTKWIMGGVVALAVLGFGYYAISPLFRNIGADDALPQNSTELSTNSTIATTATSSAGEAAMTHEGAAMKDENPTPVTGTVGHPASGTVRVVTTDGKNYIRYENFKTINGPDIYVYLSKDLGAKEYISLGKVTATDGNINYEIPAGVNPEDYKYVLTWCKTFGVLFNSAQIN